MSKTFCYLKEPGIQEKTERQTDYCNSKLSGAGAVIDICTK